MTKSKEVDIFFVPEINNLEMNAVKACWAGEASASQQRMALDVTINKLSMADLMSYQPGSFDQTAFLSGREFVGKAIRRILKSQQLNKE
jgi:hypothetical protein